MSRVIQDSDDEFDDDLEVEVQRTEAKDASPKQSASDASSTEALRRQIEAAHRAHLQSQYSLVDNQTPATLEVNHQKRKASAEFDLYSPSRRNASSNNTLISCVKRARGILGSSSGDLPQDQNLIDRDSQPADQHNGTNWVLEGTMREAYAQHNPNAMFPEPSSTVPNATLTQQRVLEGVIAPALLGSDVDPGRIPFQPDASIPWSEYLKSPTNTGEQPRSSVQHSHGSQQTSLPASGPLLNDGSGLYISQSNRRESLTLVGCLSPQYKSTCVVDTHDLTVFPKDEVAFEATLPLATPSSTVSESLRGKTPCSSRNPRKMKRIPSPGTTSDDDLADFGLPKEQYKPRPSRSRSLKTGTQDSIDYSVRPEKTTKANRRRRTTTAITSAVYPPSTPDRIRQICEMGFTPSTSAKALKQNNGDVTQSVDWLINNRVADDELVSHIPQISRGDNRQVAANYDTKIHDSDLNAGDIVDDQAKPMDIGAASNAVANNMATAEMDTIMSVVELKSPAKVQVVIPAKPPKPAAEISVAPETSRKKATRRKTTLDRPESNATDDAVTEAKVEKKRGRGRPKKAAETASFAEAVHEGEEEGPGEQMRNSPLLYIDGNVRPASVQQQAVKDTGSPNSIKSVQGSGSSQLENTKTAVAISKSTPDPFELPDRPEVEPITPERVKKPAPQERPSSNKAAKVPYRVGLSKRTRIAPLLRVIKK